MEPVRTIDVGGDVLTGTDLEIVTEMRARTFTETKSLRDYVQHVANRSAELGGPAIVLDLPPDADDHAAASALLTALFDIGAACICPA